MAKKKKPEIRFKGFTDDWEQRKLGELCDVYDGTHQTPSYKDSGIMFLSVENIKTLRSEKYISEEDFKRDFSIYPEKYDVLMTRIGDIGTANIVESNEPKAYYVSLALLKKKFLDPYFLKESIASEVVKKELWQRTLHIAFPKKINKNEITQITVPYPISKEEQQQIGIFFKYLNNLITLHQRKCEKLKNMKKAMLEKLFPKNGSNIPEVRFRGFTDDWEQRKLRDVAENFEYGLNVAAKEFDGVKKYIRITDIDDESRQFKQDDLTSPDTDLEIADRYKLEKGDILFARTGASVGKSFIYRDSDGLVYYAGFLIRGKIKPNFDIEFIFQNTLTRNYENYIRITSQRSGQPGVNAQEYQEFTLRVPICEEQKKIGAFLYNLDHLITLHQRQLEKLKNVKKSMLEKMFV